MQKSPITFAGVRSATSPLGKGDWTFDAVLRRVLGLSRAVELERARHQESKDDGSAVHALRIFARGLDADALQKLEALMRAGRDARPLGSISAALLDRGSEDAHEPRGLFDDRPSTRTVARRLQSPRRRRSRLVVLPIDSVVGRRCRSDRPALRRAALAMSARLGACRGA